MPALQLENLRVGRACIHIHTDEANVSTQIKNTGIALFCDCI